MNKELIIVVLLVVLVLASAVQALQLIQMSNSISSGTVSVKSDTTSTPQSSGVQAPSNIQNLPSMVGGC